MLITGLTVYESLWNAGSYWQQCRSGTDHACLVLVIDTTMPRGSGYHLHSWIGACAVTYLKSLPPVMAQYILVCGTQADDFTSKLMPTYHRYAGKGIPTRLGRHGNLWVAAGDA